MSAPPIKTIPSRFPMSHFLKKAGRRLGVIFDASDAVGKMITAACSPLQRSILFQHLSAPIAVKDGCGAVCREE